MTDHKELKRLAEHAKALDHNENSKWYEWGYIINNGATYPKNARFIAATSPDVVIGLIDALEALQAENARIGIDAAKQIVVLRSNYNTLKKLIDEGNIHERILSAGIEQEREISELRAEVDRLQTQTNERGALAIANGIRMERAEAEISKWMALAEGNIKLNEHLTALPQKLLLEHSGCGHGTQIEQVTVRLNRGDKVVLIMGPHTAAIEGVK